MSFVIRHSRHLATLSPCLLVLFLALPARALDTSRSLTQYAHRIWQTQQGLPQATIYCVHQSKDGYIWLGTLTGPVRFDGVRFTRITQLGDISLADIPILDITEDSEGALYFATDGQGLIRFAHHTATRFLPNARVQRLLVDSQNNLWAATSTGLQRLSPSSQSFTPIPAENFPTQNLRALAQTKDGRIWIAGDSPRLTLFNGQSFQQQPLASFPPTATIQSLAATPDGTLWIASSAGLVSLDLQNHERHFTTANGLAADFVWCLAATPDNTLYAGTRDGFSRILTSAHPPEIDTFHAKDGLSQSNVYALAEDKEGSLWLATKHGLDQFLDGRVSPLTTREGLPSNDTGPILQTHDGAIYIGTLDAGLTRYTNHRFTTLTTTDGLPSNRIQSLVESPTGDLYIGTDKGLAKLHNGQISRLPSESKMPDVIRSLLSDNSGKLAIGTPSGLATLIDNRISFADLWPNITALLQRKDGAIAFASNETVLFLGGPDLKPSESAINVHAPIEALYEDSAGILWIGTVGSGLTMADRSVTHRFTMRDGLFDDDIFAILADHQNRLWFACSKGIFSVPRQDLLDYAAGKIPRLTCTPFSPNDALRTIECKPGIQPAAALMQDGRLWFATTRGIVLLDPAHLPRRLALPPVVIEQVAVDGRAEDPADIASLPAGRKNLTFRYTGLSFIAPSRLTFRYQLVGFDKSWIDAGSRREAFYTNLPPGHYQFKVQVLNVDDSWSDPGIATAAAPFALAPLWYQHAWFIPACLAAFLALAFAAFYIRLRALRQRMQLIVNERSRIARELHDTLLQGFSGITMEMQALSVRLSDSAPRQTLEEIIRDATLCLREARRSVANLRDRTSAGFPALLESAARKLLADSPLRLTLNLPRSSQLKLPANIEYTLMRIAREAITNTLKHSHATALEITLAINPDHLLLQLQDDGQGFTPAPPGAPHGNARPAGSPGHYGLIGMKERAAEINATLEILAAPNQGTRIIVRVPLKSAPISLLAIPPAPVAAVEGASP